MYASHFDFDQEPIENERSVALHNGLLLSAFDMLIVPNSIAQARYVAGFAIRDATRMHINQDRMQQSL
jgi:hypothetical protein